MTTFIAYLDSSQHYNEKYYKTKCQKTVFEQVTADMMYLYFCFVFFVFIFQKDSGNTRMYFCPSLLCGQLGSRGGYDIMLSCVRR